MDDKRRLPLVYVRGFAGGTRGIERAVNDPFHGFNEGSTHVRVGAHNQPVFHQFESPLLRLLLDEGYQLLVEGSQDAYLDSHAKVPADSVWVHRFYDRSSGTWGGRPQEYQLENAAADLLDLIDRLREKTGAPAVILVAHSMGGLICRCLLQKVLPDRGRDAGCVAKLFTYGTPHGGIAFDVGGGLLERVRDAFGIQGADIFGPRRMYEYLTPRAELDPDGPPRGWDARRMPEGPGTLPLERVFCLVGTNPADYDVAFGLSSAAVGPHSDGLVQIERAYVPGAQRAFVHRSHSGRYGMVNSEEGYQNLRRFLFGDRRIEAELVGHRLPGEEEDLVWQAETRLSVRGLPVVMHERLAAHWCPIQLDASQDGQEKPVSLATTFLNSELRPTTDQPMRFILQLRILSLRETGGFLDLGEHLEQTADFADTLVIDVGTPESGAGIWATWNSEIPGAIRDHRIAGAPLSDEDPAAGRWVAHIPLPSTAAPLLGPDARIRLTATPWT